MQKVLRKQCSKRKNQEIQRPETRGANRDLPGSAGDTRHPITPTDLPEDNGNQCPNKGREKKHSRLWEKDLNICTPANFLSF